MKWNMKNKKIYFAGPLFSGAEKKFNLELCDKLEKVGFKVFLPQRDGIEKNKSPYDKMELEQKKKILFEIDRDKIIESEIFLFVLDGRVPDEGACVELGIAYSDKFFNNKNKTLIGLQTDIRSAFISSKLNPMLKVPLDFIVSTEEELIKILKI
ncbi:MAG: hypothetical protein UR22_C0001G0128 [Parcubacteria group bacterium GW2011_GWC2_32_10]|nr:MAG: hypothetical protein UR22_C0001G0128 [Parcubacteria group bacterium GW2011_GWC2_32_10]